MMFEMTRTSDLLVGGKASYQLMRLSLDRLFDATDNDADKVVAVKELRRLVSSIFSDEKTITEKNDAVNKVMDFFDKNDDDQITEAEFIKGFELWAMEADKSTSSSDFFPKNMGTQVTNSPNFVGQYLSGFDCFGFRCRS